MRSWNYSDFIHSYLHSSHQSNKTSHFASSQCKCPKNSNTKVSDKMTYANSADPDQTQEQSDQGLHCLPFH